MEDARMKRRRRPLHGRHLLTLGALALLGLSGYELWIRLEDFWAWSSGIRHLSQVRGTPFIQDMAIVFEAPEMRQLGYKMLFLLGAVIFAIICLLIGFVIGKEVSTTPQNEDVDGRIVVVEDNDGRPSHRDDTGDINEGRTSQNEDKRWTSPGNNDISSAPASRRSYMIGFYDLENLFDT